MYAFVLIHFGNEIKYLEYELYFFMNLKNNTKHDIIYLYSINDTPKEFVDTVKKINIKTIGYDDKNITYNIQYNSVYEHFNTLRTCNFMFSYLLLEYKKICTLESDMIIMNNIDSIFEYKCPSVYWAMNDIKLSKQNTNYQLTINKKEVLRNCQKGTPINGGVILLEPSIKSFKILLKNLQKVIENNCSFPNETLFISSISPLFNIPIRFNYSIYRFKDYYKFKNINIIHFHKTIYKPLDFSKENFIDKTNHKVKQKLLKYYHKNVYKKNYEKINKLIENLNN